MFTLNINTWKGDKNLVIWGTGTLARKFLDTFSFLRDFSLFFIDNSNSNIFIYNEQKYQKISFEMFNQNPDLLKEMKLIICSGSYIEITELLQSHDYKLFEDFLPYFLFTERYPSVAHQPPYSYEFLCKKLSKYSFYRFDDFNYKESENFFFSRLEKPKNSFITLRHDVDNDPRYALEMAYIENKYNIKSTYFILFSDTARIWFHPQIIDKTLDIIYTIQSLGHEIGLHYDFYGDYFKHGKLPKDEIIRALDILKKKNIKPVGCASHGSYTMQKLLGTQSSEKYHEKWRNFTIWHETQKETDKLSLNNRTMEIPNLWLKDYALKYEAYFVEHNWFFSDINSFWSGGASSKQLTQIECRQCNILEILENEMRDKDSMIISVHPEQWAYSMQE